MSCVFSKSAGVSQITYPTFNWLKSRKLSSGTSSDNVVSHEGGEGPRESEDLEATETERIELGVLKRTPNSVRPIHKES